VLFRSGFAASKASNQKNDALLIWQRAYEVDGCGFFLNIESQQYKPDNEEIIPASLQKIDTTWVEIEYILLNKPVATWCGDLPFITETPGIHLISIKEK